MSAHSDLNSSEQAPSNDPAAGSRAQTPAAGPSTWAFPWLLLVAPGRTWQARTVPSIFGGLLAVWLLWASGWLLAARWYFELSDAAGLSSTDAPFSMMQSVLAAFMLLPALAAGLLLFALLIFSAWRLIGLSVPLKQVCIWLLNGNMPYALGILISWLMFAIVQPMHSSADLAIALELRPFSLGLASLLPATFPALSLPWFIGAYCDLFAVWSAYVLYLGAAHYLGLGKVKALWAILALVLIWVGLLTGLWIVIHRFISF